MGIIIGGLQKSSLLDYPEKISAIIFTQGCNFRCGYCHNPELINPEKTSPINETAFFDFLKRRVGKLDGVVITGGEPTCQKDLKSFIYKIKELGFLVKLDSNGSNPQILFDLANENLIDYFAMDIKAPLSKYESICGYKKIENIKKSVEFIKSSNIDYEFRTTVLRKQLTFEDFEEIGNFLNGAERYYLQRFVATKILDDKLMCEKTYNDEEFSHIINTLRQQIKNVELR